MTGGNIRNFVRHEKCFSLLMEICQNLKGKFLGRVEIDAKQKFQIFLIRIIFDFISWRIRNLRYKL